MIRSYQTEEGVAPKRKTYDLSTFKGVNTTVAEENLPFNYSPKSYNFSFGKGVLETGYGAEDAYIRTSQGSWQIKKRGISVRFLKFFRYTMHYLTTRVEKLVAYASDGKLYEMTISDLYSGFSPIGSYGEIYDAAPYVYNGSDGLLIAAETGLYFLRAFSMTRLSFAEVITTMCLHSDRIFAVMKLDEYRLYFSDDFDPSNWNIALKEGGYVAFDTEMGKIIKVMSYAGYVYLFFEHGVMRLTAYNLQTEFRLQKLYLSPGTIYKNTIALCGDKIVFAATDGVFLFDGVQIKKVLEEVEDLFSSDFSEAFAVHHGGKYYLACRMEMDSLIEQGNNSLLVYDLWRQSAEILHDVRIRAMISIDIDAVRGVLAEFSSPADYLGLIGKVGRIGETPTVKVWESPTLTLRSAGGKKFLRYFRVRCQGAGDAKVITDGKETVYPLKSGLNKLAVLRPFDKLKIVFRFEDAEARITLAELTIDYYGE